MWVAEAYTFRAGRASDLCEHLMSCRRAGFDESNPVPSARLLPAAVLAQRVGLAGLVE
jgi:hypothetical protein